MDGRAILPQGWHAMSPLLNPDGSFNCGLWDGVRTSVGGVRYYYIDFGISSLGESWVQGRDGQERAPELSEEGKLYDPYKLDVYILGMTYGELIMVRLVPSGLQHEGSLTIRSALGQGRLPMALNSLNDSHGAKRPTFGS